MPGAFDMTTRGLFIDGTQTDASGAAESLIRDPATGQEIARVARASAADVDRAVTVAHRPLPRLESRNAGKPISAARGEISAVAATFDYYAGAVDKFHGQTIPTQARGTLLTFPDPIGVCAAITPWNFPMVILAWKVAPALAMG